MPTWLVTGGGRGLGAQIAQAALDAGHRVVSVERNPSGSADDDPERLLRVRGDVLDPDALSTAVNAAITRFGSLDIVVNNAGYGLFGPIEETSDEEARSVFDVNVFGLLNVCRAVLPTMRRARTGRIINISSVAGVAAAPGSGIYAATKFAVEGISEALAQELAEVGVGVHVVEPGRFRTDFLSPSSARETAAPADPDYASTVSYLRDLSAQSGKQPGDPRKASQVIVELGQMTDPPFRLALGSDSVSRIRSKAQSLTDELTRWEQLSVSTDF